MNDGDTTLRFSLLGSLEVRRGSEELQLGAHQSRLALALLLVRAGNLVQVAELVDLLWGAAVPPTAVNMVHHYIGMVRRILEPDLPARAGGRWLLRDVGGYRLVLPDAAFDLSEFRGRVAAGREASDQSSALDHLLGGLSLWRGRCAAGLGPAVDSHPDFLAIEREYLAAAGDAATIALQHGAAGRVLPVLRTAVARHPLDESLQARLVLALAADGSQTEAMARYSAVRNQLAEELGVDPGPELQAAFQAVLSGDPVSPVAAVVPTTAQPVVITPAQLPSDLHVFAGRESTLDTALAVLSDDSSMPIVAFDGMPGVGKTTLAVHLAHRLTPQFPDGQLYADLGGFDPRRRSIEPTDVLQAFLAALAVGPELIPASLDGRAALFRSVTADRRMLIVLDDACDVEQVRPLLPGTSRNAVVVTSRGRLGGLATAHGAHLHNLDVLTEGDSRACLSRRVGAARAAAEPDVIDQIIQLCGRLPLALAIVGAQAAFEPGRPLRQIANELRTGGNVLTAFSHEDLDLDVRAVFTWSYRQLSAGAARLLRFLPAHVGREFGAEAAASLAGTALGEARTHLAELLRTGLLSRHRPGRYRLHDLVRAFADERNREQDTPADREATRQRIENHYLQAMYAAVRLIRPGFDEIDLPALRADVTLVDHDNRPAAHRWFGEEFVTVREVIAEAAGRPETGVCWKLALLAKDMYRVSYMWSEWAATAAVALDAATRAGDVPGMAQSHRSLAGARHYAGDPASAALHLKAAAELFVESGDVIGQAEVLMNLGRLAHTEGRYAAGIALLHEALPVFRNGGRRSHELNVLVMLADLHRLAGDEDRSRETTVTGARMARALGDVTKVELSLLTLSRLEARRGRTAAALRICRHYIDSHHHRRENTELATILIDAGVILYDAGEVDDAGHLWARAGSLADAEVLCSYLDSWMSRERQAVYRQAVDEFPRAA